jgi:glycosyltransferase involved in cell wall biosynthesis
MRILMLGWEFPPFIAGGLGTACYGLTRALDRKGHEVYFVLPRPVDRSHASHIRLISPLSARSVARAGPGPAAYNGALGTVPESAGATPAERAAAAAGPAYTMPGLTNVVFRAVPASFSSPYPGGGAVGLAGSGLAGGVGVAGMEPSLAAALAGEEAAVAGAIPPGPMVAGYEGDMVGASERYARLVVALCRHERFDVVHAHDWMTYPAGQAIARLTGRPLVVHVHSTEFDRSGENINSRVYEIERRGMHAALRVIAVSELTKSICVRRYGVDAGKVDVVYNGIDSESAQPLPGSRLNARDKIVLYLGRITMQKGPEYFIRAAKRVLEKVPEAKFVVAGSGDMAVRMIEEAAHLGIGHRVLFTGFLRGPDVDRIFRMADCYVMPSVSEPFGIAPLEAMRNDVPVIISRQSGVSEVLTHALKVDFWDIDEMANKIVAVLRHPPLSQTLREHGSFELRKLTWDGAAEKCLQSYRLALEMQGAAPVAAARR